MGDNKVRNDNTYQSETNATLNNFYESLRQLEIVTVSSFKLKIDKLSKPVG